MTESPWPHLLPTSHHRYDLLSSQARVTKKDQTTGTAPPRAFKAPVPRAKRPSRRHACARLQESTLCEAMVPPGGRAGGQPEWQQAAQRTCE